jgi:RNA polymerase sigma factor (sigma-70 family)
MPTRILVGPALRAQPDRRLVELAREGHRPALEEIVRRYRPALVRYAATIVPPDRADDVVQDSIARALPTLCDGDSELHLRPWLYTIVRNAALNNVRDAGPATDHLDESFDGVEQPPQVLERREELEAVVAGIQALPDSQRNALVKREVEGRSHAEIGAAMGVSVAAARQLIHRGRSALREGLGILVPMPLVRQLLEGIGAPAAAGTGAGGTLATKALVGLLVAGGAITTGVVVERRSQPERSGPHLAGPANPFHGSTRSLPGAGLLADAEQARGPRDGGSGAAPRRDRSGQSAHTTLASPHDRGDATAGHPRGNSGPGSDETRHGSGQRDDPPLAEGRGHDGGGDGSSHGGGERSGGEKGSGHGGGQGDESVGEHPTRGKDGDGSGEERGGGTKTGSSGEGSGEGETGTDHGGSGSGHGGSGTDMTRPPEKSRLPGPAEG